MQGREEGNLEEKEEVEKGGKGFGREGGEIFGKKWHVCKVVNLENGSCKRKGKRVSAGEFARKLG